MPRTPVFVAALAVGTTLMLTPAAHAEPDAATVVARVNGTEITLGHMIIAFATLPPQYQQVEAAVLYDAILDQLIQQTALQQAFAGETPNHVELSLENERRALVAAEEIQRVMADAASEQAVQAAYDEQYGENYGGEEFYASHILLETEEDANAVKTELDAGADFAETAKARSTGPTGPNGGALGWLKEGQTVPEFETALKALEPGQISDPVKSKFGWHVILLAEKRVLDAPEFDEVKQELVNTLRQRAVEAHVAELTAAAEVERPEISDLDPEILRDLDAVRN